MVMEIEEVAEWDENKMANEIGWLLRTYYQAVDVDNSLILFLQKKKQ